MVPDEAGDLAAVRSQGGWSGNLTSNRGGGRDHGRQLLGAERHEVPPQRLPDNPEAKQGGSLCCPGGEVGTLDGRHEAHST